MDKHIEVNAADGIVWITLNRPEKLNAFVGRMRRDLADALEHAGGNMDVRVIVLRGAGRAFCAGGDVATMAELMRDDNADEFARMLGAGRRVVTAIRQMTKPVIASISGAASGAGFNLALACDLGLLNRVVPDDQLEAETRRLAERLAAAPPESIAAAKHAVYLSHHAELEEMLQYETEAQLRCFQTPEAREGVRAFLETRPPRFQGCV